MSYGKGALPLTRVQTTLPVSSDRQVKSTTEASNSEVYFVEHKPQPSRHLVSKVESVGSVVGCRLLRRG